MAKNYIVKSGDTLDSIAKLQMGNTLAATRIADFNGLIGADQPMVGQTIQLPSARDLKSTTAPRPRAATWPAAPNGFQAICQTYGDITAYIDGNGDIKPDWESKFIVRQALPFAIPLGWDTSKTASGIRCHKLLAPLFAEVFKRIVEQGLQSAVVTYGGCYQYRAKRMGVKPSTHSWGIAIDLNPNTNAMGTNGDMHPGIVAIFEGLGFVWGGRWAGKNKDPMHFQYCAGY